MTFKDSVPSLQAQRDAFLSMLGQLLKTLGFERVAFVTFFGKTDTSAFPFIRQNHLQFVYICLNGS